jgi:hypothetical protein
MYISMPVEGVHASRTRGILSGKVVVVIKMKASEV